MTAPFDVSRSAGRIAYPLAATFQADKLHALLLAGKAERTVELARESSRLAVLTSNPSEGPSGLDRAMSALNMYAAQEAIEEIERRPRPHRGRQLRDMPVVRPSNPLRAARGDPGGAALHRLPHHNEFVLRSASCVAAWSRSRWAPRRTPRPGVLTAAPPSVGLSPIRDATWRLPRYSAMRKTDRRGEA